AFDRHHKWCHITASTCVDIATCLKQLFNHAQTTVLSCHYDWWRTPQTSHVRHRTNSGFPLRFIEIFGPLLDHVVNIFTFRFLEIGTEGGISAGFHEILDDRFELRATSSA